MNKLFFLKKWGVLCISLSLLLIFIQGIFFNIEMPLKPIEKSSSVNFILLIAIMTFTVVPLLEEFMFRGFLFKKQILIILSTVLACVYLCYRHLNLFFLGFFILQVVMLGVWLYKGRPRNLLLKILLIVNACFFQSLHQDLLGFKYFIAYPLFVLGLGFVFIVQYLFLNHGFFKAVLFHALWNLLVVTVGISDLQFPDKTLHETENNELIISWNEAPLFNSKKVRFDDFRHDYKTILIRDLFPQQKDSISNKLKNSFYQTKVDQRYDFTIKFKDSTFTNSNNFLIEAYKLLEEEGLIKEINN